MHEDGEKYYGHRNNGYHEYNEDNNISENTNTTQKYTDDPSHFYDLESIPTKEPPETTIRE